MNPIAVRIEATRLLTLNLICPDNTRDQLRGAHDLALVHDDRADDDAPMRFQPPLVSCIALFGNVARPWTGNARSATLPCPGTPARLLKKRRSVMQPHDDADNLPSFRNVQ